MSWTEKLFRLLFFFLVFYGKGCISTTLSRSSSVPMANLQGIDGDSIKIDCNPPYQSVGNYCLLIDNMIRGTWSDMRDVCLDTDGDLVNLQDANILYEISQYLKRNGMDDINYWVGATDEAEEGKWVWSSDNTEVKSGAPLWGHRYGQQPDGGEEQNCGVLYVRNIYYMHDDSCNAPAYGVICQPTASGELMPTDDHDLNTKFNELNIDCPFPHEMIGNACLQVFPEWSYTWAEGKVLCDESGDHLVKIDDANLLGAIYDYFTEREINTYIWIGGTDKASEDEWVWHDATPVKRGTPFWDVNDGGTQEPDGGTSSNCVLLWWNYSYYFGDYKCLTRNGVICQYDM